MKSAKKKLTFFIEGPRNSTKNVKTSSAVNLFIFRVFTLFVVSQPLSGEQQYKIQPSTGNKRKSKKKKKTTRKKNVKPLTVDTQNDS